MKRKVVITTECRLMLPRGHSLAILKQALFILQICFVRVFQNLSKMQWGYATITLEKGIISCARRQHYLPLETAHIKERSLITLN